jgi:hypothetical protein
MEKYAKFVAYFGKMKVMDCSVVVGTSGSRAHACVPPSQNTHTNTGYIVEKYP